MKADEISPDLLSLIVNAAHSDELEANQGRSEGNKKTCECLKCGVPVPKTQFPKHMRNCEG